MEQSTTERRRLWLDGAAGNRIAGDLHGAALDPPRGAVILAHGGGQTRHSWRGTAERLAGAGWAAVTIDQRGHGDSAWVEDGDYSYDAFAADLEAVAGQVAARIGLPPALIGASLGGMAGMIAAGERTADIAALVLVDITPSVKREGVACVLDFMGAHAEEGFATLEDAAAAIASYLPHRPPPKDLSGLKKNLRYDPDGRYRWHWDPRFLAFRERTAEGARVLEQRMIAAARGLDMPVLLVRGRESELVGEAEAEAFRALVPQAELADVSGARHMVAGDKNDVFADAVLTFLDGLPAARDELRL